jgi:hypothetical protein
MSRDPEYALRAQTSDTTFATISIDNTDLNGLTCHRYDTLLISSRHGKEIQWQFEWSSVKQ